MRNIIIAIAVGLTGCGMPAQQIRPDAGSSEYQVDALQCDYESSSSTANYGSGQNTARTYGGAASQGFATGMAQGMARNDLFVKCMRAKYAARGETSRIAPKPIAYEGRQMFPPAGATPVVAASIKGESKYQITAEGVAKVEGCNPPNAAMTSKGAGMEMFAIACPSGTTMAIRCEVDGCRVLR